MNVEIYDGRRFITNAAEDEAIHSLNPEVDLVEVTPPHLTSAQVADIGAYLAPYVRARPDRQHYFDLPRVATVPETAASLQAQLQAAGIPLNGHPAGHRLLMQMVWHFRTVGRLTVRKDVTVSLLVHHGKNPYAFWHLEGSTGMQSLQTFGAGAHTCMQWVPLAAVQNKAAHQRVHYTRRYGQIMGCAEYGIPESACRRVGLGNLALFRGCTYQETPTKGLFHRGATLQEGDFRFGMAVFC